jgi:hypothetical protein
MMHGLTNPKKILGDVGVKVKISPKQVMNAQKGYRCISVVILNFDARK